MQIRESEFGNLIAEYSDVLYLCHRNADPDAIGSGFALQCAFGGTLGVVESISSIGKTLVEAIGAKPLINPSIDDYDFVVVVDTSVWLQLGEISLSKYAVVDHHQDEDLLKDAKFYISKRTSSTAEIVWKILLDNGIKISREVALGLLVGIITDTGRFKHANTGTFQTVTELLDIGGVDYYEAISILSRIPSSLSRRIAALKAVRRAKIDWIGDWIVATTNVNSFEGSSAMMLVNIGADVVFAGGQHGSVCRISGRASRGAIQAGVDLAEIMSDFAKMHGGSGGGHSGAAALEVEGTPDLLLDECMKRALEILRAR
jgi:phosphoesterase RecJ-like protein